MIILCYVDTEFQLFSCFSDEERCTPHPLIPLVRICVHAVCLLRFCAGHLLGGNCLLMNIGYVVQYFFTWERFGGGRGCSLTAQDICLPYLFFFPWWNMCAWNVLESTLCCLPPRQNAFWWKKGNILKTSYYYIVIEWNVKCIIRLLCHKHYFI